MSYILEALKTSERKRGDGQVPDLLAVHALPPTRSRPSGWRSAFFAVLLANVVALAGWQLLRDNGEQQSAAAATESENRHRLSAMQAEERAAAAPPAVVGGPAEAPLPTGNPDPMEPADAPRPVAVSDDPITVTPQRREVSRAGETRAARVETPAPDPMPERLSPVAPGRPAADGEAEGEAPAAREPLAARAHAPRAVDAAALSVPGIDDLPAERRAELPDIRISVHSYSERPEARAVRINGLFVREGGFVENDLQVVEISPLGVVLQQRDLRFFVSKTDTVSGARPRFPRSG